MDPSLTSVYLHQAGDVFRVGYGPLLTVTTGSFTVDPQEVQRLTTSLDAVAQAKADADKAEAEAAAQAAEAPAPAEG